MSLDNNEMRIRLEAISDDNWKQDAQQRISQLPKKLQVFGGLLIGAENVLPNMDYVARFHAVSGLARDFDTLTANQRLKVLQAAHPELGVDLGDWWTSAQEDPYQVGYARRAFRAPSDPAFTAPARFRAMSRLVSVLGPYRRDVAWLAVWRGGLYFGGGESTSLLASVIDHNAEHGDEVFATIMQTVRGEHEIATMNRGAIGALLRCSRPEGWELVEGLLLAAQRQEGLRQSILEQADMGNRDVFVRLMQVISEHNLLRFAAGIRAVGVWVGLPFDVEHKAAAKALLADLIGVLSDEVFAAEALASDDPLRLYTALVGLATQDATAAVQRGCGLLAGLAPPCRIAVAHFLGAVGQPGTTALIELLDDQDLSVAFAAFDQLRSDLTNVRSHSHAQSIEPLLRLVERMEKPVVVQPVLFGGAAAEGTRSEVLLASIESQAGEPDVFLPYFDDFDADTRQAFARSCQSRPSVSDDVRACLLRIVGGRGWGAGAAAAEALTNVGLQSEDAPALEGLLTRKATNLRQGVVALLTSLPEIERNASAERLWATGHDGQRDAACELVADLDTPEATDLRIAWSAVATDRQRQLLSVEEDAPAAIDALYRSSARTPAIQPSGITKPKPLVTTAAAKLLDGLDDLAHKHRDHEVVFVGTQGSTTKLLSDVKRFPYPPGNRTQVPQDSSDMVLGEVVRAWWEKRPKTMREKDGAEATRALLVTKALRDRHYQDGNWRSLLGQDGATLRYPEAIDHWLRWLVGDELPAHLVDEFMTASEYLGQQVSQEQIATLRPKQGQYIRSDFRRALTQGSWHSLLRDHATGGDGSDALIDRLWRLERWIEEPAPGIRPESGYLWWAHEAYERGLATEADVISLALRSDSTLQFYTRRRRNEADKPRVTALVDQIRDAIVAAELARGALPTETSSSVRAISSIEGADLAMQLVSRLGSLSWARGYVWGDDKKGTISHLIRVSYPAADDSSETLQAAAHEHGVKEKRLVEFGVYAPQWAPLVEHVLGWPGFEEAVWWIHAHTKDDRWSVTTELRETWAAMSAERTPLTSEDLIDGAVDIDWFWRVHDQLDAKKWAQVHGAGKYAASGSGHRRAQLFADVLTGSSKEAALIKQVVTKRHQDSVRGLGLAPLPTAPKANRASQLKRYQVLREFDRGIRAFGSQRQVSERAALRIGLENLARNAGYRDPARFGWAMEADELSDLANGPLAVVHDDVTITLSIDDRGIADLAVDRAGKALKQVPTKLRKLDDVIDLKERKAQLTKQVSRVRTSLEAAMTHADSFTHADIDNLQRHPVVAPMLKTLVLVDRSGKCMRLDGDRHVSAANRVVTPSAKGDGELRIAHPVDLMASKKWGEWQAWCFVDGIQQPFKQVFRELYVPTAAELTGEPRSERYAGHQVQPSQAKALFTARAWHTHHDDYAITKTFHTEGLVARVGLDEGFFSVADVELPVVQGLWFTQRGDYKAQAIDTVPRVLFSEVMRDLDLVVSVAHAGGVDPEASASTVEMRAALVRETATVMGLTNLRQVGDHVVIDGKRGEYSLHLGSGVVHRRPGGQVCVVPVQAQHRGRLFLPFADDDPRTAEVLSKLLLFARDDQIQDPTILAQLTV